MGHDDLSVSSGGISLSRRRIFAPYVTRRPLPLPVGSKRGWGRPVVAPWPVASDLHFGQPGVPSAAHLDALKEIITRCDRISFVFAGDMVHDSPWAYALLRRDFLDLLPCPYLVARGNHDTGKETCWTDLGTSGRPSSLPRWCGYCLGRYCRNWRSHVVPRSKCRTSCRMVEAPSRSQGNFACPPCCTGAPRR